MLSQVHFFTLLQLLSQWHCKGLLIRQMLPAKACLSFHPYFLEVSSSESQLKEELGANLSSAILVIDHYVEES